MPTGFSRSREQPRVSSFPNARPRGPARSHEASHINEIQHHDARWAGHEKAISCRLASPGSLPDFCFGGRRFLSPLTIVERQPPVNTTASHHSRRQANDSRRIASLRVVMGPPTHRLLAPCAACASLAGLGPRCDAVVLTDVVEGSVDSSAQCARRSGRGVSLQGCNNGKTQAVSISVPRSHPWHGRCFGSGPARE